MEIESCNNQVKGMLYINIDIFEYFYVVNNYFKHLQHCIFLTINYDLDVKKLFPQYQLNLNTSFNTVFFLLI